MFRSTSIEKSRCSKAVNQVPDISPVTIMLQNKLPPIYIVDVPKVIFVKYT